MHAEESRSKMIAKQNNPQLIEKKVITKPIDYATLNQLSTDFNTRFVPHTESYAEQAFWSQYSVQTDEPTYSAITKGTWGFEHTKSCFRDDIIPFVKNLKDLFTSFDQYLIDEVSEVQKIFKQMEMAVEQNCAAKTKFQSKMESVLKENNCLLKHALGVEIVNIVINDCMNVNCLTVDASKTEFQTKMESVLKENDRLLKHALGVDIVNIVVNDCMNVNCLTVDACEKCVTIESELKTDFIKKENYEMLLKQYHTLEKHCISLELNNQLNTEIFQRDNVSSSESAPTFAELFETNELKAQIQEKDTVTKLTAENNHLKQTYKQLFDSIKSSRVQSKEQCDDLINKVNLKSVEVADLNASLQEKVLVITALKEQLKGKAVLPKAVSLNTIDPALLQVDVVPLIPKLRKNRTAHIDYIKHTLEEAATFRELVESERLLSPLNTPLTYACKYTRRIQELLMILQQTCPRITDLGTTLVVVTPKNQNKQRDNVSPSESGH
nr:hypothetical protein [Tanacetum cinerariifolium]